MEKWQVAALIAVGVILLLISVMMRANYGEKYELRTIDLVLVLVPLLLVLIITGKMKVLDAFGIKADFSDLFTRAAGQTIEEQVGGLSSPPVDEVVTMLEMASKGGVRDIPQLVENKTQALKFRLGHGGYYGPAINEYYDTLAASSYLQYFIIKDRDSRFFGMYIANDLGVFFRTGEHSAYEEFADLLNNGDSSARQRLAQLPGFIGASQAVVRNESKGAVLKKMDSLKVDRLPVVDDEGVFVGAIERPQLTASLILDVMDRLDGAANTDP